MFCKFFARLRRLKAKNMADSSCNIPGYAHGKVVHSEESKCHLFEYHLLEAFEENIVNFVG